MTSKRVAIVTGSNKGIGLAIVRALCKKFDGAVYLTSRDETRGKDAVKILEGEGLHPNFHILDVSNEQSIQALKDYLVSKYGGVDVFVHNAGMAYKAADPAGFPEQARVTIFNNFTSMVNLCNTFLPVMRAEGRFVTVSSFVARMTIKKCSKEVQDFFRSSDLTEEQLVQKMDEFVKLAQTEEHEKKGFPSSAYGMSKLGVTALTRIMGRKAQKLAQPNVLVNCACPGYVNTDMSSHKGHKTPDQGAESPVYLATLPAGLKEPQGEFWCEDKLDKWYDGC
uniref:carbonyl reductase [NADPH] 1-like n=1 Tax=Styela clava TaxID=7725 RepID=UPI001939AF8A|nr:carbonyl reductase [NADPH] 1-like [Styela clava]